MGHINDIDGKELESARDDRQMMKGMGLHDRIKYDDETEIIRVPGGWIYIFQYGQNTVSCFVPYSEDM